MNPCEYCGNAWTDEIIERMCVCGHIFGYHVGEHPHHCVEQQDSQETCPCTEFKAALFYGPNLPTAEEIYESLRGS